ncbi:hypothetical protein, partial [Bacteroides gallinaceum]
HTKTDTSSQEKLFGEIQNSFLIKIPKSFPIFGVSDRVVLSIRTASFYGFPIKTVRSPIENRTFSIWKPYGFHMENVKRR